MSLWWMSFRDEVHNRHLGTCVVEAMNEINASEVAWAKEINPGGEVLMLKMTEGEFAEEPLEMDRLYSKQEMTDLGYDFVENRHIPPKILEKLG